VERIGSAAEPGDEWDVFGFFGGMDGEDFDAEDFIVGERDDEGADLVLFLDGFTLEGQMGFGSALDDVLDFVAEPIAQIDEGPRFEFVDEFLRFGRPFGLERLVGEFLVGAPRFRLIDLICEGRSMKPIVIKHALNRLPGHCMIRGCRFSRIRAE